MTVHTVLGSIDKLFPVLLFQFQCTYFCVDFTCLCMHISPCLNAFKLCTMPFY